MSFLTHLALTALCFTISCADSQDMNMTAYIYWQKTDIETMHNQVVRPALKAELSKIDMAMEAIQCLDGSLDNSLQAIMKDQFQALATGEELMAGTNAEGCVQGIKDYITNAIIDAVDTYRDCAADGPSKYSRFYSAWQKTNASCEASKQRALNGIDMCVKTYPNKDSADRLKSCAESMYKNYMSEASRCLASLMPSPAMNYFKSTVVTCAEDAAITILDNGKKFNDMLGDCAELSGNMDVPAYKAELAKWTGCNITLGSQITNVQYVSSLIKNLYDEKFKSFYVTQKDARMKYVLQSRPYSYHVSLYFSVLASYYNTIINTQMDNPADTNCTTTAMKELDNIVYQAANKSLSCDRYIVDDTQARLNDILMDFSLMGQEMSSVGEEQIYGILCDGFIYEENYITDYFNLNATELYIKQCDIYERIEGNISYLANSWAFYNGTDTTDPCGVSIIQTALYQAAVTARNCQRCLYMSSATTYDVTTPATTATSSTTTTPNGL